jgi:hypothetical protein
MIQISCMHTCNFGFSSTFRSFNSCLIPFRFHRRITQLTLSQLHFLCFRASSLPFHDLFPSLSVRFLSNRVQIMKNLLNLASLVLSGSIESDALPSSDSAKQSYLAMLKVHHRYSNPIVQVGTRPHNPAILQSSIV